MVKSSFNSQSNDYIGRFPRPQLKAMRTFKIFSQPYTYCPENKKFLKKKRKKKRQARKGAETIQKAQLWNKTFNRELLLCKWALKLPEDIKIQHPTGFSWSFWKVEGTTDRTWDILTMCLRSFIFLSFFFPSFSCVKQIVHRKLFQELSLHFPVQSYNRVLLASGSAYA